MLLRFRETPSPFIAEEWRLFTHALQGHSPHIYETGAGHDALLTNLDLERAGDRVGVKGSG